MSITSRLYDILISYKPESFQNDKEVIMAFPKMHEEISNELIQIKSIEDKYRKLKMDMMQHIDELKILKKPIGQNVESILDNIHDIVRKISDNCNCEIDDDLTKYYESLMGNAEMTMRLTTNQLDCYYHEADECKNEITKLEKDKEYLLNKIEDSEEDYEKCCIVVERQKKEIEILKVSIDHSKGSNCHSNVMDKFKSKIEPENTKKKQEFVVNGEAENLPPVSITQSLTEAGLDFDKIIANLTFSIDKYKKGNEYLEILIKEKDLIYTTSQEKVKALKAKIANERIKFKKDWEWFQNSIKERNFIIGNLENDKQLLEKELFAALMEAKKNGDDKQTISKLSIIEKKNLNDNKNYNDSLQDNLRIIDKYEDQKVLKNCQSDSALKNYIANELVNITTENDVSNENTLDLGPNKQMYDRIKNLEGKLKSCNDRIHFLEVELGLAEKLVAETREKRQTDQEHIEKLQIEIKKYDSDNMDEKIINGKN